MVGTLSRHREPRHELVTEPNDQFAGQTTNERQTPCAVATLGS
jgi:hypothetical protein